MATFPTCHDPTLRELLRLGLPQRYIALVRCCCGGVADGAAAFARAAAADWGVHLLLVSLCCALKNLPHLHRIEQVHNPEYLNDTAISSMVRDHGVRLLAISPHVGNYARQILEEQGVQVLRGQWPACLGLACVRWQRTR